MEIPKQANTKTGNGNSYTQNISTVKKSQADKTTCCKESTKTKSKIQNNKTKIKISEHNIRNYLKFLINLYLKLKLILCISQINKSVFKVLKNTIKTNTTYHAKAKDFQLENCNINSNQQQEQQHLPLLKAQCFKTISFKFKIVINVLIKFSHYGRQNNVVTNVKKSIKETLHNKKIKRDFIGICPKRLISFKRLQQQIPENHINSWSIATKASKISYHNYQSSNEELRQVPIKELQFNKKTRELRKSMTKQYMQITCESYFKNCHLHEANKPIKSNSVNKNYEHCRLDVKDQNNKIICPPRQSKETHSRHAIKTLRTPENVYKKCTTLSNNQERNIIKKSRQLVKQKYQDHNQTNNLKSYSQNYKKTLYKSHQYVDHNWIPRCIQRINKNSPQTADFKYNLFCWSSSDFKMQEVFKNSANKCCQHKICGPLTEHNKSNPKLMVNFRTKYEDAELLKYISNTSKQCYQLKKFNNVTEIKREIGNQMETDQAPLQIFENFTKYKGKLKVSYGCCKLLQLVLTIPKYTCHANKNCSALQHLTNKESQIKANTFYVQSSKISHFGVYKLQVMFEIPLISKSQDFKVTEAYNYTIKCDQIQKVNDLILQDVKITLLNLWHILKCSNNNWSKIITNAALKRNFDKTEIFFQNSIKKCSLVSNRQTLSEPLKELNTNQCPKANNRQVCPAQSNKKNLNIPKCSQKYYKLIMFNRDLYLREQKLADFFLLNLPEMENHHILTAKRISLDYKFNNNNFTNYFQTQNTQSIYPSKCDLLNRTSVEDGNKELANYKKSNKEFILHNNDFHEISRHLRHNEIKQQEFLKKYQQFLYFIFLYYCCCCSGFPLVLAKIFKYLKDSTVHVLTRLRLKISRTIKTTTTKISSSKAATSIDYKYDNVIAACGGKLKRRPTKVADYKTNQQNVFKRQTHTTTKTLSKLTTKTLCSYAYSSSCCYCSTTSLTASSTCSSSSGSLILQQKQQPQPKWSPYCHYQQHQHHHYHHHHHLPHQQIRQQLHTQQQQQLLRQQQSYQQYNSSSTIHLQLPSLLVFSRTLIILILLSSLWHTSEGFHGSGVKLSTNTVKTKYGLVRGIVVRSSPSLVEAYLGIPYASPPVGSLRFMPPITPSAWKNVRNADRFSPVCPQNVPIPPNGPEALLEVPRARLAQLRRLLPLLSNQSEDCLYLNIYVPSENRRQRRFTTNSGELNDSAKLPTILFIHGESYEWNSGNPYDGSELAAHGNVIVVTINFRLGILGFLKTGGKESAQGNFGLMDLVAGLHWLKENLPAFGGDPQAITLLGHGTGAALANILVISPVASDLVQHIVMVSGSALSPWAIQKNPLFVKRRVAEQTGCHGDMLYYDLAPCLRTKTVAELLAVKIDHPRFLAGFAPFIDGTVISPNTKSIAKLSLPLGSAIVSTSGIEYANFPKRNLIFCLTSVESHLDLSAQDLEFGFNETRRDRILRTYVRNNFHYHLNEIFAVLKNEYTEWDKAIRSPLSSRDATLQFLSDGHTASSLIKLGYMHSLKGGRGYFLHFKHRTVEEEYPQRTGSVRGEDVPFWLGLPISPLFPHNYTTQEKQISRLMLKYLANFAKTGNPNQSSLSSPLSSSSSLIGTPPLITSSSSSSPSSNQTAADPHDKFKRSSFNIVNATSSNSSTSGPIINNAIIEDVATAAAREALNLAVLYNQRRTKRTYYKRHSRSNDDHSGSASNEVNYFLNTNNNNQLGSDELPFWDAYDVVNQLYMELGNKAEIQSHYRGHKLSMWLNLIPQLHRHANMNDQSMRHHQFQDDLNNLNLYEGIVRAQIQTKPDDDEETLLLPKIRPTAPPTPQETNTTEKPNGVTTECGVDGAMFVAEMTTIPPSDNRSLVLDSREKEMATASTGLIGNLEVLRRLSGKQFQSYTTALIATVAVGCFLLILNILIFAGIYHQREKRARDAKTKEELQDNDTSKNSSMLKLNALGSETGSFNGSGAGVSGKTTVVFGEYSCYDEKSLQTKNEKLIVELPPSQMVDSNWAACSTSTLDLLKTKHHTPHDNTTYTLSTVVPINTEAPTEHLIAVNAMEMATYNPLPMSSGLIIDPALATTSSSTSLLNKRGSFVGSSSQLNQYDFASVQSSDQMSFKDIENAVKASATMDDDITQDDDIPEPPPPPRSFHNMQQQQQQQGNTNNPTTTASGSGSGGGILRQAGTTSATQTGGGKKRVHIQEISV